MNKIPLVVVFEDKQVVLKPDLIIRNSVAKTLEISIRPDAEQVV